MAPQFAPVIIVSPKTINLSLMVESHPQHALKLLCVVSVVCIC